MGGYGNLLKGWIVPVCQEDLANPQIKALDFNVAHIRHRRSLKNRHQRSWRCGVDVAYIERLRLRSSQFRDPEYRQINWRRRRKAFYGEEPRF